MKKFAAGLPLKMKIVSSAVALFLEACVEAFGWLFAWIGFFICIWLIGYNSRETTILFWFGVLVLYIFGLRKLQIPSRAEIIHRVETSSQLKHRPLQSLRDRQATQGLNDLWDLEKSRQTELLKKLRHSLPNLKLSERDPYALRIVFVLIIFCAIFVAPAQWSQKIKAGLFLPQMQDAGMVEQPFAQLRITPPVYSGMKVLIINQSSSKPIEILPGSTLTAEIQTSWRQPYLKMAEQKLPLKRKDNSDTWTIESPIPQTDEIKISSLGITRFSQSVKWIEDTPPIIGWNGDIGILPSGEMRIPLKIADDFGIRKLILRGILSPSEDIPFFGSPLNLEKKMNLSLRNAASDLNVVFDTTGHEWAGKRVSIMVEAEDFAGNISETAPLEITLPQRSFKNAVAIALASIRSDLLNLRGNTSLIAEAVEEILYRPDLYKWDMMMTLGLRSIDSRLHYSDSKEDLQSVASMLWSLAMHIEDGNISQTQTSLREALDNLQAALQKGADKTEISSLMQEMQRALIEHLQTLARQMQQNAQPSLTSKNIQYNMNLNGLSEFLQKLQDDIRNGNSQSAMQKLNDLQQLTDMMGSSMAQGLSQETQDMMQDLSDLQNLIGRQRKLLDQTRLTEAEKINGLSKEQKDILAKAKEMADKIKLPLPPLREAQSELEKSASSLDTKDKDASIGHQQAALDKLEQASQSMQQQLKQKMQNMMGISLGSSSEETDPLGRERGQSTNSNVEIPGGAKGKKTDHIIKMLREREGDMKRPMEERNYYQRLLKQW